MKILNADEIFTLSIKVTEPIERRHLLSSLRTAIKNKTSTNTKNCHFQFYYNAPTLTYEVLFYEKTSDDIVLEPVIIITNKSPRNNENKIKVFVTYGYLVVTQNQQILIFKKIDAIEDEEILLYVKQIYKIDDFELIRVSNKEIEELDTSIDLENTNTTYPLAESKAFKIFTMLSVSGLILLAMSIYFTHYTEEKNPVDLLSKEVIIKAIDKKMIVNHTLILFKNISLYKIGLEKINYRNKIITAIVSHPKKEILLEFSNLYKKRLKIRSIKFDDTVTFYVAEVSIEY